MALLLVAGALAVLEWRFELRKNRSGIYLTKPAVMILLVIWLVWFTAMPSLFGDAAAATLSWFILGLVFCLGGDIFLMLPARRYFLPGLISFLAGHVFYIIGFGRLAPVDGNWMAAGAILLGIGLIAFRVFLLLSKGMKASGTEKMRIPVGVYSLVISLMLYSALMTLFDPAWSVAPSLLVSLGALSFLISDIMNAWVRFVSEFPRQRLWVMSTYHFAQFCIAIGVSLHYINLTV